MEVYHNGEQGTLYDNDWDFYNAQVVYSQLGFG